ncbi:MAG TPA: amidohydrolase family protein [Candidatus Sumerlaeota bacterium]|nr:amidohydrolase family protein [Candidatus Sumerlaeota bacterium]HPS01060.1 amidohydrolase family protein [Candidatus Sumerlaeota bacterium]
MATWASKQKMLWVFCLILWGSVFPAGAKEKTPDTKKEDAKWDVMKPSGPSAKAEIDTDEGTWMSLDVSPDGQFIVFDLLGDLYEMPIAGGEAKALTEGVAWDMQPTYNPDGKKIAFTSDRGGGDNIWVMERNGSNPHAVTQENYRLLNSPVWTPDGQYLAARKHFTSTRSLGAGEVWLYHVPDGGEGVQMTARPNDQKDLGEPAFSFDGRYLFFSQDVTPGAVFEYDKDSNAGIYAIKRLDRETGEIETVTGGPGGAIRPTPSPDGKYLAFVRRVRGQSTLFLREQASGVEWPVCSELERDMQEAWAIHGVYPHFSWLPDARTVVFWAAGKIHRLNVETKETSVIPFHVKDKRRVTVADRFPVPTAPDRFKVKMLRWVQVSPDEKRVVYQALGHLYVRNLPDGEPKRLTQQNDHFEFYPSWSRDGKQIVYTSWNDDTLGAVRTIPSEGGESKVWTKEPGAYVEPAFSPDGSTIVYRKVSAGKLMTPTWMDEQGVYSLNLKDGEPVRIARSGSQPHFAMDDSEVFLLDGDEDGQRALVTVNLKNREKRTCFTSGNATEFHVSPDGNWVAFTERFNAYVIPFTHSGREVAIGPDTKAVPVRKVSRDAGRNLHWSGNSQTLYWNLGPELFSRKLTESFAFVEGASEKQPEPAEKGKDISFEAKTDVPSGALALTGARIVTMHGNDTIEKGTVVIEGNRIKAVGPDGQVQIPADAKVVDVSGKTILPGLIDVHAHGAYGGSGLIPQRNYQQYANMAFGVTTNHDPSNDTETIFAASEMGRAGETLLPRVFSTGSILYGASGDVHAEVNNLDDARSHLRRMKAVGAFSVKSYNQPRRDQRQQIIEAGRELGMLIIPEGGSLFQMNMTMVVDGHQAIEHIPPVPNMYKDVLQLWPRSGTVLTPTLIVAYGGLGGENYWYQHSNVWENERLMHFMPREVVDPRSRRRTMAPEEEFNHIQESRICKQLTDTGVGIQLGAHGQLAGLGAHWELWMLAQGGMTPMEVLRAATLNGARYLGMERDLGSVETGKLADLIVLDRNPLEDIHNSESIACTILNGRIFDAHTMNQIGNHPAPCGKFYWETDYRATTLRPTPSEANSHKDWEKKIQKFEEEDRQKFPPRDAVLFVGSSSIEFWEDPQKDFPEIPVIKRGLGGTKVSDMIEYASRIVLPYHPRALVFYGGDNDIPFGRSPEGVFEDFKAFAAIIHKTLPEAKIFYLAIKPSQSRWNLWDKARRVNSLIARYAETDSRVIFVDTATPVLGEDGTPRKELFLKDQLHLSPAGYQVWAQVVRQVLTEKGILQKK